MVHIICGAGLLLQRYKSNFLVIGFVCIMSIIFWSVYEQSGNTIVMFVNRGVDRDVGKFTVPTEWFQYVDFFFKSPGQWFYYQHASAVMFDVNYACRVKAQTVG